MMPRLDLTPATIALPHDLSPGTRSQGRYWPRDFRPWLTREAILEAALSESRSEVEGDMDAAHCWLVRDAATQVGLTHNFVRDLNEVQQIKRSLRQRRNGGAR